MAGKMFCSPEFNGEYKEDGEKSIRFEVTDNIGDHVADVFPDHSVTISVFKVESLSVVRLLSFCSMLALRFPQQ